MRSLREMVPSWERRASFLNGKHLRTQAHCNSSGSVKAKSNSLIVWRWNVQINVHLNSSSGLTNEALVEDFNITLQHSPVSTPFFFFQCSTGEVETKICYISQIIHILNNLQIAACCIASHDIMQVYLVISWLLITIICKILSNIICK